MGEGERTSRVCKKGSLIPGRAKRLNTVMKACEPHTWETEARVQGLPRLHHDFEMSLVYTARLYLKI